MSIETPRAIPVIFRSGEGVILGLTEYGVDGPIYHERNVSGVCGEFSETLYDAFARLQDEIGRLRQQVARLESARG